MQIFKRHVLFMTVFMIHGKFKSHNQVVAKFQSAIKHY